MEAMGYIRCSTAEQALEGMSLQAQASRIAAWCEATDFDLIDVVEDAPESAERDLCLRVQVASRSLPSFRHAIQPWMLSWSRGSTGWDGTPRRL